MSRRSKAVRFMRAPAGTTVSDVRELVTVDETQTYDPVAPWEDIGVGLGSYEYDSVYGTISYGIKELRGVIRGGGEQFAFAALYQDENLVIHAHAWSAVELGPAPLLLGELKLKPRSVKVEV